MVGAEYASFTLMKGDGALGERVDSYQGSESLTVANRPAELDRLVLESWAPRYVGDTRTVDWANPSLVGNGILSCLGLPVRIDKRLVGILSFCSAQCNAFRDEMEFLESVCGLLAGPLLRAELRTSPTSAVRGRKRFSKIFFTFREVMAEGGCKRGRRQKGDVV